MRKPDPSALTAEQGATLEPLSPDSAVGRPGEVEIREVLTPAPGAFAARIADGRWSMAGRSGATVSRCGRNTVLSHDPASPLSHALARRGGSSLPVEASVSLSPGES